MLRLFPRAELADGVLAKAESISPGVQNTIRPIAPRKPA